MDVAPPLQAGETRRDGLPQLPRSQATSGTPGTLRLEPPCVGASNLLCWVAATVAVLVAVLAGDKAGRGPTLARQPPIYNRLGVGRGGGEGPSWGQSHLL